MTPFTNKAIPQHIAELSYAQQQALLFGGGAPYVFAFPDGRIAHKCGKGLAGLYRVLRWQQERRSDRK